MSESLSPEMEKELEAYVSAMITPEQSHSYTTSEYILLLIFIAILVCNRWLQMPDEHLKWIGIATGGWTTARQFLKANGK